MSLSIAASLDGEGTDKCSVEQNRLVAKSRKSVRTSKGGGLATLQARLELVGALRVTPSRREGRQTGLGGNARPGCQTGLG